MKLFLAIAFVILGFVYCDKPNGAVPMVAGKRTQQAKDHLREKFEAYTGALNTFTDNIRKLKTATRTLLERSVESLHRSHKDAKEITANFQVVYENCMHTIVDGIETSKNNLLDTLVGHH